MSPDAELARVEEANARFYRAFESLDLREMEAVWAKGGHVKCVHPGWGLLAGWESVRVSWETIFKNTAEIRFSVTDVDVQDAERQAGERDGADPRHLHHRGRSPGSKK